MNRQRPPKRRRIAIGVLVSITAAAAWGGIYLSGSETGAESGTEVDSDTGTLVDGDTGFAATQPSPERQDLLIMGDDKALATYETTVPSGGYTALPASGDPIKGTFSPVVDWPLIGIHAVLTPDGRVLTYGTPAAGTKSGYFIYDVWDPQLGLDYPSHTVLPNNTAVDIFCNAQLLLPNGNIEMWGGDVTDLSTGRSMLLANDDSNVFNPLDNTLIRTGKMHRKRWYATATTLPSGEVYIQGGTDGTNSTGTGGKDYPEVRTSTGQFRLLTGASTLYLPALYPRNFVAPDGKIFGFHYTQMYRIDPTGAGTLTRAGKFYSSNKGSTSTAVMFRPGRILQVGGGTDASLASDEAHVIDINTQTPVVTAVARPAYRRHWANATVLPDGRVFLSGGSTADNSAANGVAYTSELYDPATDTWSRGATAQRMRLYHSSSLLLPDGSVLTTGGGALGPERNLNAEIYYPPYLFQADGTPAPRPVIASLPMTTDPGRRVRIGTPVPSTIRRVTLVKVGSNTHSFDMDQRFLELPFTIVGGELEANLPNNVFETPPGFYMVFVINDRGVPSEAAMMRINVVSSPPPQEPATLRVTKVVVNDDGGSRQASDFSFSINGAAAVAFESDGDNVLSLPAGTYSVTEPAASGYAASYSGCTGIVLEAGGSATCTITNDDQPEPEPEPEPEPGNLVVNGDFEDNPVPDGSGQLLDSVSGWFNNFGPIEIWRNNFGYQPGLNASYLEIDGAGSVTNRIDQYIPTTAGASYELSFLYSPRPGNSAASNRFDVFWNGKRILRVLDADGTGMTDTSWRRAVLMITGNGSRGRLSFREADSDDRGVLIDDVRVVAR